MPQAPQPPRAASAQAGESFTPAAVLWRDSRLSVIDYRCAAGPGDKPFAEQYSRHSVSYVRKGTFACHCRGRLFDLVAGSVLVGHPGDEYMCTHDHHAGGDECLSFQLEPAFVADIGDAAAVWRCGAMPPLPGLVVLGQLGQAAAQGQAGIGLDEVGMMIAARFVGLHRGRSSSRRAASARDRARAVRAALWIETHSAQAIGLDGAAAQAGLSAFHFLRMFSRVFGVTPHQYLIRCRLRHATQLLAEESMAVTDVALEAGFADLSNFVRTFGQAAGMPPLRLRRLAKGERQLVLDRLALPLPR
jgi:AraC family transcriptional regulator